MVKITALWIEKDPQTFTPVAIRIDWDNDYHHRMELRSLDSKGVIEAFYSLTHLLKHGVKENDI